MNYSKYFIIVMLLCCHDLHKEKHRFKNSFIVNSCLSCRKNTTLDFFYDPRLFTLTLHFLPSPSTFYPHPRLFTLTLDIEPSTLDPRQKPKLE